MLRHSFLLACLLVPTAAAAQLPNSSTRSLGMGGAYSTLARGHEAVMWNPAMLAAHGRQSFTIGLPQVAIEVGSNTYSFSDFRTYSDSVLTDADKRYLLDQISLDDSVLTVRTIAGVAPFGISIGPLAFSGGTVVDGDLSIGRDALELALFGNASRAGPGEFYTAAGSRARGWAATTLGASFAHGFSIPAGRLSVGVTYKSVIGHFLGRGDETSSRFEVNPRFSARAAGHAVYTTYPGDYEVSGAGDLLGGEGKAGSGYGLDLGAVLQFGGRRLTLSAVVTNLLGSMTWDAARLRYDRVDNNVRENPDGSVQDTLIRTSLTGQQIAGDPTARALRDALLANSGFARVVRAGIAYSAGGLSLAGEAAIRLSEGLDRVPGQRIAGGAEYRLLRIIPLRAGIATDLAETVTFSAGTGLQLLGLNIDISAASISGSDRPGAVVGLGIGFIY